ncbi:Putative transposase [Alloalcanivorax dieselolei B5]|jgi:hypothetical protein|uniref:Putative transposase n=1 Tax=Alcanivorax dieselolei (strain DSM 16502 / CGMCC 1.3690 / MCCC 1A00001 / B-5) TaxID=930169 RepID=K0CBD0_ALCDB|nr:MULTISPECIES: transposase [Alloalcanivorax]AFT70859.1 Putative transposase [Alloalcanivorax dieselolei B5]KYZ85032.1 hypothetical protein A3Q32_21285 [Alcanivorax sp. KX64203]PHS65794.1 MAG: hypothetical protein COB00_10515 [Alcanivorax sp.]GGJ98333.1 hypothetical protein GCM10007426_29310 [Alloalcanivorax dieselolei]
MLEDNMRRWIEEFRGEQLELVLIKMLVDAKREGMDRGSTEEARNILRDQLFRRFGQITEDIEARLNDADRERLESWIDRPYEVDTLEAVFE